MIEVRNLPVFGHVFTSVETKVGTADIVNNDIEITLDHALTDKIQELVKQGAEIKAFHINIEMLAAQPKED